MNEQLPPIWIRKFFTWFCREELHDTVEDDLITLYSRKRRHMSALKANTWYFFTVLTFLQPFALKQIQNNHLNPIDMFYNNLKIGVRFMKKHITYSAINVLGLAMGLSAVTLISLFIIDELSYDKFHVQGENIVRLTYKLETPNSNRQGAKLPFPTKEVLTSGYPEVIDVVRFYHWSGDTPLLAYGDQKHTEEGIYFSEPDVFKVFDFDLIKGNPTTALANPRSIVITEKMAAKYFGYEDPMGKVMRYKNENDLVVTGVLKDVPENSHITFDFLLPIELQRQRWLEWGQGQSTYDLEKDWNWAATWVYALIHTNTELTTFESELQAIARDHLNTDEQGGFSIEVQPLYDIHLKSDKSAEASANGNLTQLYSFGAIAALILFIACVNFINLSSAQAGKRLNEVGLRKVMGAKKGQLIAQFFAEALLLVSISALLALALAYTSLPYFNNFTAKSLSISLYDQPFFMLLIAIVFGVALLSGLRPSLAAIRVQAIEGIGNKFGFIQSKQRFNRAMVIVQFVICNLMIIGILVVNNQLDFLQNKDLGFDKEQMLVLRHGRNLSGPQFDAFKNKMAAIPSVQNINRGYVAGTRAYTNTFKIVNDANTDTYSLGIKWIGEGFTDMYGLDVVAGRNFDENSKTDLKSGILVNESAIKALGWSIDESIGNELSFLPGGASQPEKIRVIGVLADANFESLYDPILPSVFRRTESSVGSEVTLKLVDSGNLSNSLDQIEAVWASVIPEWPFEFSFLDDQIESQYIKEERLTSAIQYFTILAIFIACMGLFGLASFDAQQRTKEIGIRKVLGASMRSIFMLISKRFLWLIGLALLLSTPVGYYLFDLWLQDFAYRVEIGPVVFLSAAIISLIITIVAVGGQSLKAASRHPSDTLRYE